MQGKQWQGSVAIQLLITRPEPDGAQFAQAVQAACSAELDIILSPLLRIVPVAADLQVVERLIFTSANGVAQAARLKARPGTPAYCVGPKTADLAAKAGFEPIQGPGDAAGLAQMIIDDAPGGALAHIRGAHARGDISATLMRAGLTCHDVIAYTQEALRLTDTALTALRGEKSVVVPLFSPRTGTIFGKAEAFRAPLHVVAISRNVLPGLSAATTRVATAPTFAAMVLATCDCIQGLIDA